MPFTVLFDACVLYPQSLRDLLMRLAMTGIFRARWTDAIQDEWTRNLLKRPGMDASKVQRTRQLMNDAIPDCLVTHYEATATGLTLASVSDRHVLAAAIHCGAELIVTTNLKDFPHNELAPFDILARHPDDFVIDQTSLHSLMVLRVMREQRVCLSNPPKTPEDMVAAFRANRLMQTAAFAEDNLDMI